MGFVYASVAERSIALDCKSNDYMSTLVRIQPGAHTKIGLGSARIEAIFVLRELDSKLAAGPQCETSKVDHWGARGGSAVQKIKSVKRLYFLRTCGRIQPGAHILLF